MTLVIQANPAVDYIQGDGVYKSGDTMAMPFESKRYGTMYHRFQVGTIAGHAEQDGKDVDQAVQECNQKMIDFPYMGHKLAWAFGLAVTLTSEPREKLVIKAQSWDDIIELDGKRYSLSKAANQNVALTEI